MIEKSFIRLLIVLIFFFGVIVFFGYYVRNIKLNDISPTKNLPTSIPDLELTRNWKTYRNDKYGFEIKYYPRSTPTETKGTIDVGQFTYLLKIDFGTVPLKSKYGFTLNINQGKSLSDYQGDLVGHITDKIDSNEQININNNFWTKINYQIFINTEEVPVTTTFINYGKFGYAITASSLDIDQILSTFKFIK